MYRFKKKLTNIKIANWNVIYFETIFVINIQRFYINYITCLFFIKICLMLLATWINYWLCALSSPFSSWDKIEKSQRGNYIRARYRKRRIIKRKDEKRKESGMQNREGGFGWIVFEYSETRARRPPNELFSSLPIYFCSLFNQLPTSHSPSRLVFRSGLLRRNIESPLPSVTAATTLNSPSSSWPSTRTAWINRGKGRRKGGAV